MYVGTDYPGQLEQAKRLTAIAAITKRSTQPSVSSKLRAVVGAPRQLLEPRKPLFTSPTGDIPYGVLESVLQRKTAYWGRYE